MNFNTNTKTLSDEEKEDIKSQFETFYQDYADGAMPGQITFVDSLYDQFTANQYLTDNQIIALNNIIEACAEWSNDGGGSLY
jgi:hypothetical protein